jgi:hypothetical protein
MAGRISTLLILMVLTADFLRSQQAVPAQQPAQGSVVPLKKFSAIHRFEILSGDPRKSRALLSFGFMPRRDISSCLTSIQKTRTSS